jgi:hypothetical protein
MAGYGLGDHVATFAVGEYRSGGSRRREVGGGLDVTAAKNNWDTFHTDSATSSNWMEKIGMYVHQQKHTGREGALAYAAHFAVHDKTTSIIVGVRKKPKT